MRVLPILIFLTFLSCRSSVKYNSIYKPYLNYIDHYFNFEEIGKKEFGIERNINNHGKNELIKYSRKMKVFRNKYSKEIVLFRNFGSSNRSYEVIVLDSNWYVISISFHAGEVY